MHNAIFVEATELLAVTGTTVATATQTTATKLRVVCNRNCHVKIGASATTSDFYLAADWEKTFSVGAGEKLEIIKATGETDGSAWVSNVRAA